MPLVTRVFNEKHTPPFCRHWLESIIVMKMQLDQKTAMAAHLSSTTLALSGDPEQAIKEAGDFLRALPCQIEQLKGTSLKARLDHPDGLWVVVKLKCHKFSKEAIGDVLEWRHYNGDCILYGLLWRMYKEFLVDGNVCPFFAGQLVTPATPVLKPSPFPEVVPTFFLDGGGEKRKIDDVL